MPSKLFLLALLALAAPPLPAQLEVYHHPPAYAAAEGPEGSAIPFGVNDPVKANRQFRYQQIHDAVVSKPTMIRSFQLRRDGTTRYDYRMCYVEMDLILSTSPNKAAQASPTFALNHGKDATALIKRTRVIFFPSTSRGRLPEDMGIHLPCG